MVCDFIDFLTMLHNNILGTIEEMRSRVDMIIKYEKIRKNAFEKVVGLHILMPLDDVLCCSHKFKPIHL
jgi:hypothetical protein